MALLRPLVPVLAQIRGRSLRRVSHSSVDKASHQPRGSELPATHHPRDRRPDHNRAPKEFLNSEAQWNLRTWHVSGDSARPPVPCRIEEATARTHLHRSETRSLKYARIFSTWQQPFEARHPLADARTGRSRP